MEFDSDGNFRPGLGWSWHGEPWVAREHGILVDRKGFVWISGNAETDSALCKFTKDGKFLLQIGKIGPPRQQRHQHARPPADIAVDDAANESIVADGYGNRRVIVFDSETGAYKRHWGAYGNKPDDAKTPKYDPAAPVAQQFGNPVHCAQGLPTTASSMSATAPTTLSRCSRRTAPSSPSGFSTSHAGRRLDVGPAISARRQPDLAAEHRRREQPLAHPAPHRRHVVSGFGRSGRYAGQFHWVHTSPSIPKATSTSAKSTTGNGCRNSSRPARPRNSSLGGYPSRRR